MIQLDQVSKVYSTPQGPVAALEGVSLAVPPGEFLVIRGPSGCGKTTLLLAIGGMLRPSTGRVLLAGQNVYGLDSGQRARLRAEQVGFVFQMFHLVPYLNVVENVLLAARPAQRETRTRADELLDRLGLASRAFHKPAALSAGERQRTALARALINRPALVLADEPTGNLDPENAATVFGHLRDFNHAGATVVVVTHGAAAEPYAHRTVELRSGRVVPTV